MDNIVSFKRRKFEAVWECDCGCQVFYVTESMRIECKVCGELSSVIFATKEQSVINV